MIENQSKISEEFKELLAVPSLTGAPLKMDSIKMGPLGTSGHKTDTDVSKRNASIVIEEETDELLESENLKEELKVMSLSAVSDVHFANLLF